MNKYVIILSIFTLSDLLIGGCIKREKRIDDTEEISSIVEEMVGKDLVFPDSLISRSPEPYITNFKVEGEKIISVIDGNCSTCVSKLKNWESCVDILKNQGYENKLFFIIEDVDSAFFNQAYGKRIPQGLTFFFDKNSVFSKVNKLPNKKMLKTFLIDSENKILLVGNPSVDKRLWNLYLDEMKNE